MIHLPDQMKEHDHGHQLIYLDKDVTIHTAQGKLNVTNTLKCNISRERCLIRIERLTFCFIIYPFVFYACIWSQLSPIIRVLMYADYFF